MALNPYGYTLAASDVDAVEQIVLAMGGGSITSYTAAQLTALAAAGGLTAGATYAVVENGLPVFYLAINGYKLTKNSLRRFPGMTTFGSADKTLAGCSSFALTNTYHLTETVPFHFDAVQFAILHTGVTDMLSMQAAVCVSDTMTDPAVLTPSWTVAGVTQTALGSPAGWKRVTWSGANSTPAIPATGADGDVVHIGAWSDLLPISSIARLDGGVGAILNSRFYYGGVGSLQTHWAGFSSGSGGLATYTEAQALANGVESGFRSMYRKSVDGIAVPTALSSATRGISMIAHLKQFKVRGRFIPSVLFVGDSRIENGFITGDAATVSNSNVPRLTENLMFRRGTPISAHCTGGNGKVSLLYYGWAMQLLAACPTDACVYLVNTVNDGGISDAIVDTQIAQAQAIYDTCKSMGVAFIPITAYPSDSSFTAPQLAMFARIIAWCRDAVGADYSDPYTNLGDGTGRWRADIPHSGDHSNLLGRQLQAMELSSILSKLVG